MATLIDRPETAGEGEPDFDLRPPPGARSKIPELAVGVLVVVVFALAGLWLVAAATDGDAVLALRNPIARGEVVALEDLQVVKISSDEAIASVGEAEAGEMVGRVALVDLPAGALVTTSQFAAIDALEVGEGQVGLELNAGELPSLRLLPGNTVTVVLTPAGSGTVLEDGGAFRAGEVLVEAAVVVEAAPVGIQGRQFVALAMTEEEATAVAVAASQGRVRLVQVARDR